MNRQWMRMLLLALYGVLALEPGSACAADTNSLKSVLRSVERDAKGRVRKGYLARPTLVDGLPCKMWIRFREDQTVSMCRLSSDTVIQGQRLPAESTIWFHDNGRPFRVWLGRPMTVQGLPCKGGPVKKTDTVFYPNGRLEGTFIAAPVTIQDIPCQKSGLVMLYPDGKLKQCLLARACTIDGKPYQKKLIVHLDEQGRVTATEPLPTAWEIVKQIVAFNTRKFKR